MKTATYPTTLCPDGYEMHIVDGREVQIPTVRLEFKKWQGVPIANTFGGKGLIDYEGEAMFAELAIMKTAIAGGWNARWIETYAMKGKKPYHFSVWGDGPLPTQIQDPITDKVPLESLELVAKHNDDSYSGCWDVLLWNDNRVIYAEAKRIGKDSVRATQDRWLEAGLWAGFDESNFIFVWWDFA
jgi:hypothetical protein